jgi:hypothetical protein
MSEKQEILTFVGNELDVRLRLNPLISKEFGNSAITNGKLIPKHFAIWTHARIRLFSMEVRKI